MASKNLKGITIEIGGDTGPLAKALADVNKKSRDLEGELKEVNRLLKLDPGNTVLVTQKQKLLADSVTNTKGKLETLKEAEKQAQAQFKKGDLSEEQYRDLQREIVNAETKLKSLEAQGRQTNAVLSKDQAIGNLKNIGKAAAVGAVAAGVAIGGMVVKVVENADELQRQADVTGLSAERLQELEYAGNNLGVSLDTITGAQTKLTKSMNSAKNGTKETTLSLEEQEAISLKVERAQTNYNEAIKKHGKNSLEAREASQKLNEAQAVSEITLSGSAAAFDKLGIKVVDSNGNLRDSKVVMQEAFDALGKVGNETERDALAMEIFGKSGMELNPIIKAGGDELNRLSEEAKTSGAVMSNEAVAGLDSFGDTIDNLKSSVMGSFGEKFAELLPTIQGFLDKLKELPNWINQNQTLLIILGVGIATIIALVIAFNIQQLLLNSTTGIWAFVAGNATFATTALGAAFTFLTSPIGLIILAIAAMIAIGILLYKNWDTVKLKAGELWTKIKGVFGKVEEAITGPFAAAKKVVGGIVDGIKGFFDFEWKLPKIKMPHFSVTWSTAGFWGGVGEFLGLPGKPSIGVDWYAKGGIFDQPTLFNTQYGLKGVGEAGPEVVAPLSDLKGMLGLDGSNQGLSVNIEQFINNRKQDVQAFAEELEFYKLQASKARGGR